jgi:hypothetical protein
MLAPPLFLCIGFMIAVLYIDLVFDMSALPHRRTGAPLPADVLDPIATYYRYITRNPYLLTFVMLTTTVCIVVEIVYGLVPRWAGYLSLFLMGLSMSAAVLKVIPAAQRLAAGKDTVEQQTHLVHGILPYHLVLLASILSLATVQFLCVSSR